MVEVAADVPDEITGQRPEPTRLIRSMRQSLEPDPRREEQPSLRS
jgi:hypothetical protein